MNSRTITFLALVACAASIFLAKRIASHYGDQAADQPAGSQ